MRGEPTSVSHRARLPLGCDLGFILFALWSLSCYPGRPMSAMQHHAALRLMIAG